MLSLRINNKRLPQLEKVVEYARSQGRQLDPFSSDTVWYMLDRWDSVLKVLRRVEAETLENKEILGALK